MERIQYRNRQGQWMQVDLPYVAPEVKGRIIGSGDIDQAYASMGASALSAWVTQDDVYRRLTENARVNIRQKGI